MGPRQPWLPLGSRGDRAVLLGILEMQWRTPGRCSRECVTRDAEAGAESLNNVRESFTVGVELLYESV